MSTTAIVKRRSASFGKAKVFNSNHRSANRFIPRGRDPPYPQANHEYAALELHFEPHDLMLNATFELQLSLEDAGGVYFETNSELNRFKVCMAK